MRDDHKHHERCALTGARGAAHRRRRSPCVCETRRAGAAGVGPQYHGLHHREVPQCVAAVVLWRELAPNACHHGAAVNVMFIHAIIHTTLNALSVPHTSVSVSSVGSSSGREICAGRAAQRRLMSTKASTETPITTKVPTKAMGYKVVA